MNRTINEITRTVTHAYLDSLDPKNPPPPDKVEQELLNHVCSEIGLENAVRGKSDQLRKPKTLSPAQIADIMIRLYPMCRIPGAEGRADADKDILAIYQPEGENEGIYVTSEAAFRAIARQYYYHLSDKDFREIMTVLYDEAPRKPFCRNRDIIALGNGLLDYRTKQLMPFDPQYIFLSKASVNWNHAAQNIVITEQDGRTWDFESWLMDVCDGDEGMRDLILEMIGATLRPHVKWGRAFFLYATSGANGKGTICQLCRNILGPGSHISIPLAQMSARFGLAGIEQVQAIITDENDVGDFLSKAANFKALVTFDMVTVEQKYGNVSSLKWPGIVIECFNDFPSTKDRTDSFLRRLIIVPFNKTFVGCERPEIKQDYLRRPEVLEYVVKRVLEMDYYSFHVPPICELAMAEYKEDNNPVEYFLNEMLPRFTWDLLPFEFLYQAFQGFYRDHYAGSEARIKYKRFKEELREYIKGNDEWESTESRSNGSKVRYFCPAANRMDRPEPLVYEYQLRKWMSKAYHGYDIDKMTTPDISSDTKYEGLVRKGHMPGSHPGM